MYEVEKSNEKGYDALMQKIYLDHAASTPISAEALRVTADAMKKFGANPSAIHRDGREARTALETARRDVAGVLAAHADEIVFTSGATEANNMAISGVVQAAGVGGIKKPHIIVSAIEHPSVLEVARQLERYGMRVDLLPVDEGGMVDVRLLRKSITKDTVIVSVMYANNEIGTIEPVAAIAKEIRRARKMNASAYPYFHTDASQAANYLDLNVLRLGVDLMTLSSTKTYGPRGVGALYIKRGTKISPLLHGGRHESGRRPGTESTALAIGFANALLAAQKLRVKEAKRVAILRDLLASKILKTIPGTSLNGSLAQSLPNMLNISFDGIESDALVLYLDAQGIELSGQSACKSSEDGPSHVIMAIGKGAGETAGAIRFSLGRSTTREDITRVLKELPPLVVQLRGMRVAGDQ